MNNGVSGEDAGWILAVLTTIGGGVAWLFGRRDAAKKTREEKLDRYQEELDEREKKLDAGRTAYTDRLEKRIAEVEAKEDARDALDAARDTQMRALRIAFELVSAALRKADPMNPALGLAEDVMKAAFPPVLKTPAEMVESLIAIETATGEMK